MRRLGALVLLTLLWLLATPTPAFAHCHGSITYGPGGPGDCGQAALWGTLSAAAAFAGAAAFSMLSLTVNFFREPIFRKAVLDSGEQVKRQVGQHRLNPDVPSLHRFRAFLATFVYSLPGLPQAADDMDKISGPLGEAVSAAYQYKTGNKAPDALGWAVEWAIKTGGHPAFLQGVWRRLNDMVTRIRLRAGLYW